MLGSGKAASKAHGPLNSSLNVQTLGPNKAHFQKEIHGNRNIWTRSNF